MDRRSGKHKLLMETLNAADGPMSANQLWSQLKRESAGIGIATVYRSLRKGVEQGELVAVELESGSVRYEPANMTHHHHFLCSSCSRAYDIEGCTKDLEHLLPSGFEMTRHEILLYGRCADCQLAG